VVGEGMCVRQRNTWIICVKVSSHKNSGVYFFPS
jgi:hypothetical protein